MTNGRIGGTNIKLGGLKRVAYGFVNTTNFAARALLLTPANMTKPSDERLIPRHRADPYFSVRRSDVVGFFPPEHR